MFPTMNGSGSIDKTSFDKTLEICKKQALKKPVLSYEEMLGEQRSPGGWIELFAKNATKAEKKLKNEIVNRFQSEFKKTVRTKYLT